MELAPDHRWSHADDAAFLSASYGLTPDPWQFRVLSAWLGETSAGRWAAPRAGLAVPRQNGKNGVLEVRELYGMVALGERFLHTAHEVKTARKAFLRLKSFFENPRQWPELADLVDTIRSTNGQEAITLVNGGSVEFVARSRGSGRGFTVDVLVCDEAQELTDEQQEALLPTISSAPTGNPQTLLTGTPPPPGSTAEVFVRVRTQALDGMGRLGWHEWSMRDDDDLDDPQVWAATNPGLGIRLGVDVVEMERDQLSDDGFARERCGSWNRATTGGAIDPDVWAAAADTTSRRRGTVVFAVDMPPERTHVTVGWAGRRPDGRCHVELAKLDPGTGWLVDYVAGVLRRSDGDVADVVIDPAGPAGSLVADLQAAGVQVTTMTVRDVTSAAGAFLDDLTEGRVVHVDQVPLNMAVAGARRRKVGTSWAWQRRDSSVDISPLVAVTNARWGLVKHAARKPARSGRVV